MQPFAYYINIIIYNIYNYKYMYVIIYIYSFKKKAFSHNFFLFIHWTNVFFFQMSHHKIWTP